MEEFSAQQLLPRVKFISVISPRQFYGIDRDSFGVELAKVTLMLAKKLALDEAYQALEREQIEIPFEDEALPLDNLDENFICGDTLDTIKVYSVPSPKNNSAREEVPMPSYEEVTQRAGSLRALTGLTEAEFQAVLPHFERAFVTSMHDRTVDGQPRTSRRYSTYDTCPLPTLADKLLFMLTYVKQHPMQEVQGQLCGMSQSHANKWIHLRHPVLNQALADQELLPARTAAEFAAMFETHATDGRSTTPLFGMMALNVRSTARPILKSNKNITAARKSVTRSKTSL